MTPLQVGRVLAVLLIATAAAAASNVSLLSARFADEIIAFAREDAARPPPTDPIVFTGSSSIRRWVTLREDFAGLPVLNRGFGGSTMTDLLMHFERVIGVYRPRALVLYCGENDIAQGRDPIDTANDYIELIRRCRQVRADMKILVILMKPSPRRWSLWSQMTAANRRIELICEKAEVATLDLAPLMLGSNGEPRPDLYIDDQLHMTADGYRIWAECICAWLRREGIVAADTCSSSSQCPSLDAP